MCYNKTKKMINHYATVNLLSRGASPFEGGTVQGVCVCVCVCVVSLAQGQVQAPLWQFSIWFSICLQPVHPAVIGYLAFAGVQFLSHETAMVQVGLWVATPLAVRKGLFSCDFLAWLQELCLHGSQCLLSAQASWVCQVCMTA